MFNGSNCDRKSKLSGLLTEPLNPRGVEGGQEDYCPPTASPNLPPPPSVNHTSNFE